MAKARKRGEAGRTLTVLVGESAYSLPAAQVLQVGRRPPIARVPNGHAALAGVMNFHGVAIPVVRVSALIGDADGEGGAGREAKIVVYEQDTPVALLIDDVLQLGAARGETAGVLDVGTLLAETFLAPAATPRRSAARSSQRLDRQGTARNERAVLAFAVAGQRFALPLGAVAEVLALPEEVTGLPRAEAVSVGMITLRDEVVPVLSLAALLGLEAGDGRRHVVVVALRQARIGLAVEAMHGVAKLPEDAIEPVPAILQRGGGEAEIDAIARGGEGRPLMSILSPDRLFRNRVVGEALASRATKEGTMPANAPGAAEQRFIVFTLGADRFGMPIAAVNEVVQLPDAVSRVPNAPGFVAGVISLRGKALPVIDLRIRFEAETRATPRRPRVIVVTIEQLQAGFVVDSVSDILAVPDAAVTAAPALPGNGTQVFDRVAAHGDHGEMILLVDPKALLDRAERDLLSRLEPMQGAAQAL